MRVAAVTNQTIGLPTAGSRTRIRVRGPGPIRSGLASLGEKMVLLGRSRIETVHETELNTPAVQGGGNVATFTTSSATPVPPQSRPRRPVDAPSPPPPIYQPPPVTPRPSRSASTGTSSATDACLLGLVSPGASWLRLKLGDLRKIFRPAPAPW